MKKALIGFGAVLYLLVGVWFGSLNYKVNTNPNNYNNFVRFGLFPLTTIINTGLYCANINNLDGTPCTVQAAPQKVNLGILSADAKAYVYTRVAYIIMLAIFWPLKIIANLLLLVFAVLFLALCGVLFIFTTFVFLILHWIVSVFFLLL